MGGGDINYPDQQSYSESMRESLQAQIDLAPDLFAAESDPTFGRPAYAGLEKDILEQTLLGGFTTADEQGRIITGYSEKEVDNDISGWDEMDPSVQLANEDAMDAIWQLGHKPNATYGEDEPGIALLKDMGYTADEGGVNKFFADAGWKKGTWEKASGMGGMLGGGNVSGGTQIGAKKSYDSATGVTGVTTIREPVYDEKIYGAGEKVRDPMKPGLIDLMGSTKEITVSGRNEEQQRRYDELTPRFRHLNEDEKVEYDELYSLGEGVSRKPGFDAGNRFMGLTALGEDLRSQAATSQRTGDIDDVSNILASYQKVMETARPETISQMDNVVTQMNDEMLNISGDTIAAPANLQAVAQKLQSGAPTFEAWKAQGMPGGYDPGDISPLDQKQLAGAEPAWFDPERDRKIYDDLIASGQLDQGPPTLGVDPQRASAGDMSTGTRDRFTGDKMEGYDKLSDLFSLRATMQEQAAEDLAAGGGLTDRQRRDAEQAARRWGQAAGRGLDPLAAVKEVEEVMKASGVEQDRRRAYASQVLGQEAGLQTGELGRGMQETGFNIQNEVARREANLGRKLTAEEFNIMQEAGRLEANKQRELGIGQFDIGVAEGRREADIGRELGAAGADITQKMQQEQMNEQLRQRQLQGWLGGTAQAAGLEQQAYGDPLQAILARPAGSTGFGMGQQMYGGSQFGLSSGPGVAFNPEAGLSYMLGQQSNQANFAAAQAGAQGRVGAGAMGMLGSLGGEAIGKWCWIAREVYGEDNPKWKQFRSWVLGKAPDWFREWYGSNGPSVAEWLKDKPELKARIKIFMDSKLEA